MGVVQGKVQQRGENHSFRFIRVHGGPELSVHVHLGVSNRSPTE
jgi:hypothetical protein